MVNWNNKKAALKAIREEYPHMSSYLIELCYEYYKESSKPNNNSKLQEIQKKLDETEKLQDNSEYACCDVNGNPINYLNEKGEFVGMKIINPNEETNAKIDIVENKSKLDTIKE